MHPLLARPARLLLVVVIAALSGVLLAWFLRLLEPRPWTAALAFAVPLQVITAFIVLSAWWVCRRHPLSGDEAWKSVAVQFGAALQASTVRTALGAFWAIALDRWLYHGLTRAAMYHDLFVLFVTGIPFYLLSAGAHYMYLAFEASHAAERRVLETQVGAREAELRALRAQLNPHFLFNSLNSINALVGSDPEGARRMCEGLGDFLRRTLALGARDSVTLAEELMLVDRYLDIEQLRFGDRLRVERAVDREAADCRVPPLLLQPLVENAIKHGIQDCLAGGVIRIEAKRAGDTLRVAVENPVDHDAPVRRGEGVGLENVRRRLEVFGARDSQLAASRQGDVFRVMLTLPAMADGESAGDGRG